MHTTYVLNIFLQLFRCRNSTGGVVLPSLVRVSARLCVGDPDPNPKDPHNFARSGSIIFSIYPDPDPDLNLAHFHHASPSPTH